MPNCKQFLLSRFFMTHLSRPWDGEDDDVVYSEKVLKPRLQL